MSLSLTPGTVCTTNGRVIQIDGPDSLTHMLARDMASGEMLSVPITKIEPLPHSNKDRGAGEIREAEWKRCAALAKDLTPLTHRPRVTRSELEKIAKRHAMSVRQLQRARAAFQKDPRASVLARDQGGRPSGLNLLDPQVDTIIKHAITKHYLRREKPSKEYVVQRARSMARRLKLAVPSRKAVLTRVAREAGWSADRAREGSKAAKQKWETRTGQLSIATPLELIQIDHTPADVIVLSDDRQTVLGRPWVTVAIDVATRCVVGMYISMDAPSSVSVSLCIEHSVLPKPENEAEPGIWPMYGKPKRILVDNGKDFRSMALQRGCDQHGIELSWRPVRTPHYGAHIERLIGTLMKIAHLLPGTTFSNIRERGDYDSAGKARLTLDEFRQWMTQKVCRFYHVRRHRSLGIPPVIAWERGLTGANGQFVAPPLMARPLDFRMDFLPYAMRKIRRTGIEFNASRYWHDDLASMLNSGSDALISYDPRNPGHIWTRRADGVLVTAPAIAGRAAGEPTARRALDEATRARLDAVMDTGFEATDRIEATANQATRRAKRSGGRGNKAQPKQPATQMPNSQIGSLPPMSPSKRTAVLVEEWN